MKREIRIGMSGWTYTPWRGVFFPIGLPQRQELAYASSIFPTIEINGTFYSLMKPDTFAAWAEQVPEDFIFAVKGPRFITHIKRARAAKHARARPAAAAMTKARLASEPEPVGAPSPRQAAAQLQQVGRDATHCERCLLYRDATQTVFGEGPVDALIMLVG
jgi:uncharacterized protein YecE (DUF72 family)